MEDFEYEETFEEEETEKIFNSWVKSSYREQKYYWLGFVITLIFAIYIGAATQQFIYTLLILIYMRLYRLITSLYHRQTRIAKYLMCINDKLKK